MRNPLERRIADLEAVMLPRKSDKIPVFVRREDDVPKKIEEMIAAGEVAEADRHRCAFYLNIKHEMEWIRQWEDEKLLAAETARQKAEQEQTEPHTPENAAEHEHAEQQQPESQDAAHEAAGQEITEHQTPQRQVTEQQPPEQPTPEQHPTDQPTIDLSGTIPPGCRTF